MNATETKTVWLIELTGETRQVWGPYTEAHARKEAGKRHFLAKASGLENGQTMSRGELRRAMEAGRVRSIDGLFIDAI